MKDRVLEIKNLSRSFGSVKALDRVDLILNQGELLGLVGPDGAGKTTCLRCLAGVLDPDDGQGQVLGVSFPEGMELAKARLGYMPQRFGLYPDLTAQENLSFYAEIHRVPPAERESRISSLLDFVTLTPFRGRQAGRLSGGMKQKLGLACALVHSPELLLLDEPTSGVDPVSRREFWALLSGLLVQGVSVIVATTYLDEAERCHRVTFLNRGRLIQTAPPAELKTQVPGRLVELEAWPIELASRLLAQSAGVVWANRFGLSIHALLAEKARPEELAGFLASAGVKVVALRPIEPSLEDAYIHQTSSEDSGGWI